MSGSKAMTARYPLIVIVFMVSLRCLRAICELLRPHPCPCPVTDEDDETPAPRQTKKPLRASLRAVSALHQAPAAAPQYRLSEHLPRPVGRKSIPGCAGACVSSFYGSTKRYQIRSCYRGFPID